MNIFESKWRKLLEEVLLSHKKHVKDETQIREIIGVHERIDNPYNDSMLNINQFPYYKVYFKHDYALLLTPFSHHFHTIKSILN